MKNVTIILMLAFLSMSFYGEKPKEVVIKTSAECGMCKERIEEKLNYTKGISFVSLDVKSKNLTVKYKESKITLDKIKSILSELGYNADEVMADPVAQKKLPPCCQPGGMKH